MAITRVNPVNIMPRSIFNWPRMWDEDMWSDINSNDGLDVYETDNEVVVEAAVPGIKPEDVSVTFEEGVLRIEARDEETDEKKKQKKATHRQARTRIFDYTTTLPRAVEADNITADVENGVVVVRAPIAPTAKPKRISVSAKSSKKKT